MARKRMISPEIWESQDFSQLSDIAKIVFISLFSHADDEGRGRADTGFVKSMTFPYDENRRVADIKQALSEIALHMSVQFYSVNGSEYYFMTSWEKWQRVDKPSKSKLPAPPDVGVGGITPKSEKFGECSGNVRGIVGESSPTNRIEENRIERNRIEDEYSGVKALLGNVVFDCKPIRTREEYVKAADALKMSTWARENLTHLSKIHRNFEKLVSGFYQDRKNTNGNKFTPRDGDGEFEPLKDEDI